MISRIRVHDDTMWRGLGKGLFTHQVLILGPCSHWPDKFLDLYTLEARVLHPALEIQTRTGLNVIFTRHLNEFTVKSFDGICFFQRAVGGDPGDIQINKFNPTAGLGIP